MPDGLACVAFELILAALALEVLVVGHLAGGFLGFALGAIHGALGLVLCAVTHGGSLLVAVLRCGSRSLGGARSNPLPGQGVETAARRVASVCVKIRETCICEMPMSAAISDCVRFSKKRRYRIRRSRAGSSRIAGATYAQPVGSSNRSSISPSVSDGDCASSSGLPSRDAAVKACAASTASITSDSDSPIASAISANDGDRPSVCAR